MVIMFLKIVLVTVVVLAGDGDNGDDGFHSHCINVDK